MLLMSTLLGAQSYLLENPDEQVVDFVVEYCRHLGVLTAVVIRQSFAL